MTYSKIETNNKPILLTIPGSAGLFPLTLAAAYKLNELIKYKYPNRKICYGGVSSGTIAAIVLALNIPYSKTHEYYVLSNKYYDRIYKNPYTCWLSGYAVFLNNILPENAHEILSNKLFIGRTIYKSLYEYEFEVVSVFKSKQDVIDVIISACYLFILTKFQPFKNINGKWYCDGVYIKNYVTTNDHHNIIVNFNKAKKFITYPDWLPSISIDKWEKLNNMGILMINNHLIHWNNYIVKGSHHYDPKHIKLYYLKSYAKIIAVLWFLWFIYRYRNNKYKVYQWITQNKLILYGKQLISN
jgi:hypothetical protein